MITISTFHNDIAELSNKELMELKQMLDVEIQGRINDLELSALESSSTEA